MVLHLVIDIFLICFDPAVLVLNDPIDHGIFIDSAVCRNLARVAGPAYQGNVPAL